MNKLIKKIKNFFVPIETKIEGLKWYFSVREELGYPKILFDCKRKFFWYEEAFVNFLKEQYEDDKEDFKNFEEYKEFFFKEEVIEVTEELLYICLNEKIEGINRRKFINKLFNLLFSVYYLQII